MRSTLLGTFLVCMLPACALAQDEPKTEPAPGSAPATTSDAKAAEIKRNIELGLERQRAVDARNNKLWERWTVAVCIGCGPLPIRYRAVFTNPLRVLAGITAADDDGRYNPRKL